MIHFLQDYRTGGRLYPKGSETEFTDEHEERLIGHGKAVHVDDERPYSLVEAKARHDAYQAELEAWRKAKPVKPELEPEPETEIEVEVAPEPVVEPKTGPKPEPEREVESEFVAVSEPEPQPQPVKARAPKAKQTRTRKKET